MNGAAATHEQIFADHSCSSKSSVTENAARKGRLVAFGDVGGVEGAFGVDACGAVLLAGAPPLGHHHAAVTGWPVSR
jgi:hypothetical protein